MVEVQPPSKMQNCNMPGYSLCLSPPSHRSWHGCKRLCCSFLLTLVGYHIYFHPTYPPNGNIVQHDALMQRLSSASTSFYDAPIPLVSCSIGTQSSWMSIPDFYNKSACKHDFDDSVIFFHVGKGGGGTVSQKLENNRIKIGTSHPDPHQSQIVKLQKGPAKTLIVNIRDPVDRFVSAFRWRQIVLCKPHDKRLTGGAPWRNPSKFCSNKYRKEEQMLRETYQSDPNLLAEALCEDSSPLHSTNATKDFSYLGHSTPLSKWLKFLTDPEMLDEVSPTDGIQKFYAITLEKQQGANGDGNEEQLHFKQLVEELSLQLLGSAYTREKAINIIEQNPLSQDLTTEQKREAEHSSARFHSEMTTTAPLPALSPLGECCLARYLREDYQLIQTMIGGNNENNDDTTSSTTMRGAGSVSSSAVVEVEPLVGVHPIIREACDFWGSEERREICQSDLRSMISRRARYLDLSMGSCSKVVVSTH